MSLKWERQEFYRQVTEAGRELADAYRWRLRGWWKYKVLRLELPSIDPADFPSFAKSLFSLSPTDLPFLALVNREGDETVYTWLENPRQEDEGA